MYGESGLELCRRGARRTRERKGVGLVRGVDDHVVLAVTRGYLDSGIALSIELGVAL